MQKCPRCQSDKIHVSRTRSKWESWRKEITHKRPFRCSACAWRGWAYDVPPVISGTVDTGAAAPEPPNLKNTPLALRDRRAGFDPRELDRFDFDDRQS